MVSVGNGNPALSDPAEGEYRRLRRRAIRTLALAGLVLTGAMALMGLFILNQFRATQVRDAADAGRLYIQGVLAPYALSLDETGDLPEESRELIRRVLTRKLLSDRFYVLTIWSTDGQIIYSTEPASFFDTHDQTELVEALRGNTAVDIHDDSPVARNENIEDIKLLEIYTPITSPNDGRIIAVGEMYLDATSFLARRAIVERSMWGAVSVTTAGLLSLLSIIVRQRLRLLRNLAEARRIAEQNRCLREAADRAREAASRKGEQILNEVGAELHDGPIQMLGYLMLLEDGSADPDRGAERRATTEAVLAELRAISSGLILPEIKDLTLDETLRLAIARHENVSGTTVDATLTGLPAEVSYPLRICLFRLVQEGLRNAVRHAGGKAQRVEARTVDGQIEVAVSDGGGDAEPPAAPQPGRGLGLASLRNRLEIFDGTLDFVRSEREGTRLVARVPIGPRG